MEDTEPFSDALLAALKRLWADSGVQVSSSIGGSGQQACSVLTHWGVRSAHLLEGQVSSLFSTHILRGQVKTEPFIYRERVSSK